MESVLKTDMFLNDILSPVSKCAMCMQADVDMASAFQGQRIGHRQAARSLVEGKALARDRCFDNLIVSRHGVPRLSKVQALCFSLPARLRLGPGEDCLFGGFQAGSLRARFSTPATWCG